jgi:hypothetical protein
MPRPTDETQYPIPTSMVQIRRFDVPVCIGAPRAGILRFGPSFEDPVLLTKPWTSAPRTWSLAAPDDEWTEVFCTHNDEPEEWKHMDKAVKDDYEDKYKK